MVGNGSKGKETSVSVDITEQTPFGHRFDGSNKIPCHPHNLPDLNHKFRCQVEEGTRRERRGEEGGKEGKKKRSKRKGTQARGSTFIGAEGGGRSLSL